MNTEQLVRADRVLWVRPRIADKGQWMALLEYYTANPSFPGDLLLSRSGYVAYIPVVKRGAHPLEFTLDDITGVKEIREFARVGLQVSLLGSTYRVTFTGGGYVPVVSHHPKYHRPDMGYIPTGKGSSGREAAAFWLRVFSHEIDPGQLPLVSDIR